MYGLRVCHSDHERTTPEHALFGNSHTSHSSRSETEHQRRGLRSIECKRSDDHRGQFRLTQHGRHAQCDTPVQHVPGWPASRLSGHSCVEPNLNAF